MRTGERTLLKREPVLGDFDPANYVTEYLWAPARDGAKVPVSLVYRKGVRRDGTAPLLQYGYGSYGFSTDPMFSFVACCRCSTVASSTRSRRCAAARSSAGAGTTTAGC